MAGLNENGIEIKRLTQVVEDMRADAQPIFQDLVPPGDVIDTSNSSTIGRLTALLSRPIADLWEATQQVYFAFDPNSATGIALDNLVALGGLTREPASPTQATVVLWGDQNTFIPAVTSVVRSNDNNLYDVLVSTELTSDRCIGFSVKTSSVVVGTTYSIIITNDQTTFTVSYTALSGDTFVQVLEGLQSGFSLYPSFTAVVNGNSLTVESVDINDYFGFTVSNLSTNKIKGKTEVVCQETGVIEQPANSINSIATPILGWDSVNNPFPAITGRYQETDDALRFRFRESKFLRAQNISDALYSSLVALDGVQYVRVYENETATYDPVYDLTPHSFKPIILGGNPIEIGKTIWINKPLGIASRGNTSTPVTDSQGFTRDIFFERPINIPIYIDITLTTNIDDFPANGVEKIKAALIEYFENNFSIGETVVYSRLYTPINTIQGHQIDSLTIGLSPSPTGTSNITMAYNEIASLDSANINITIS
jgi:uncharacterized phage protein gp47/JayE